MRIYMKEIRQCAECPSCGDPDRAEYGPMSLNHKCYEMSPPRRLEYRRDERTGECQGLMPIPDWCPLDDLPYREQ